MPRRPSSQCLLGVLCLLLTATPLPAVELLPEDIPGPADATLRKTDRDGPDRLSAEWWILMPEGTSHQAIGDRGRQAAEEAVEMMRANGWSLTRENRQRRGGEFWFRKEVIKEAKLSVGTWAKPIAGRMQSYVGLDYELTRLIPTVDLKGIDIPDVPRYPGSTRVRWMNLLGDFAAKYLVVGGLDEVKAFYERELPRLGWRPGPGVGTLNYTRGGATSPDDPAARGAPTGKPLEQAGKLIPTTLAVHLSERDGIVEIGFGRSAGAGDLESWAELPVTPERPPATGAAPPPVLTHVDPAELPLYEGLRLDSERQEPMSPAGEEITTYLYAKQAPPADAIAAGEFYLAEMAARGWTLLDEEWHNFRRKLSYRKGAVRVDVEVKAVGHASIRDSPRPIPIPVEVRVILPVPTRDVAGEDVEGVPRLPGSVRFYYLDVAIDRLVKFKAAASREDAEWFFIEELPKHGWTFAGNDATGLLFVPAGTAGSATQALASGQLVPTTLKVIVDDMRDGTVKVGTALTRGDT